MKRVLLLILISLLCMHASAGRISGSVTDEQGNVLPFASILVKGTGKGTTANNEGRYFLFLDPGQYTISCHYVGYEKKESAVTITASDVVLNFQLAVQKTTMKEFVVSAGAEDPAYDIIRNAIRKREQYLKQLDRFQCEVYIKGMLRLRSYPKKVFGQDVDFEDGDTSALKMLYLSETVASYSVENPGKSKIEVSSTKVSGQSDGFGLSLPQIISFYENNISIGRNLNPRGFVSPIADAALNYYRYKLEGVFFEDGKEINKIRVTPRRKYEPLFSGIVYITENDWRLHSLQLQLTKESQMDIIDTLKLEQLYVPLNDSIWVIKNQVIYPAINLFGFNAFGSFVNIYSRFNLNPHFPKNFFDNTALKFTDSSNKRTQTYWDSVRPVPLQVEELEDYRKKDSLEKARKSPEYLDSVDRKRNRFNIVSFFTSGQTFSNRKKRETFSLISVLDGVNFNTAEGLVIRLQGTYLKRPDSNSNSRKSVLVSPDVRYGFSNRHLNASLSAGGTFGKKYYSSWRIAGGKNVFQFNNNNPIRARDNTLATLVWEKNLMKTYEAWFTTLRYSQGLGDGFSASAELEYQDRMPLENRSDFKLRDVDKREYTPNFPTEQIDDNIHRHQAVILNVALSWQPGSKYIEYPERKINIGSKYPTFSLQYSKGLDDMLGSDVNYDKWRLTIDDILPLRLAGTFSYRLSAGGFLNSNTVEVPDYQHFNGNQLPFASAYMNSFQLAPYYQNSTTARFYGTANVEYHLGGLLTNKLPLIRKLNWHLVTGSNAFYVNSRNHHIEAFVGFENIFRLFRVDFVQSYAYDRKPYSGIVVGLSGSVLRN